MKHLILILLICICSNIAAYTTYQLPADTRRVNIEMKCKSCDVCYTVSMLYSKQIDTYFTNDFKPHYCPEYNFKCNSCQKSTGLIVFGSLAIFAVISLFFCVWAIYSGGKEK